VNITKQVASALAAAHDQGIVHRDLKSANVFLVEFPGEPDFVKILDFGISKVRAATTQLTKASAILGTPNYMSPEQATGMLDEIDHRTDQWAVGCIVWEMLSGRPPFASDDMSAVFYQVIHLDPQPLRKRTPELPPGVDAVLARALSKSVTDRFPSVGDFANALASAASEHPSQAVRANREAPDTSEVSAHADGTAWVERRQFRQERRRLDGPPSFARSTGTDQIGAASDVSFWRGVKPVHALSALSLSLLLVLVFAILVPLRWNPPAKAAALPLAAAPNLATSAKASPSVVAAVPLPQPSAPEAPAPAATPHRGPVKNHPAKAGRHLDDSIDPFAPPRPASDHRSQRAAKADTDFVDPFGP
jgi:serine/threonine-protein kinase